MTKEAELPRGQLVQADMAQWKFLWKVNYEGGSLKPLSAGPLALPKTPAVASALERTLAAAHSAKPIDVLELELHPQFPTSATHCGKIDSPTARSELAAGLTAATLARRPGDQVRLQVLQLHAEPYA